MTPSYSMYYIVRFWGKLKTLRECMHFNIFERPNVFNIFNFFNTNFSVSVSHFFEISKKNEVSPSSIILTVTLGRSSADHGQIMGRPWVIDSCRKILKISAFIDTVFPENVCNFAIFPHGTSKASSYFCRPR